MMRGVLHFSNENVLIRNFRHSAKDLTLAPCENGGILSCGAELDNVIYQQPPHTASTQHTPHAPRSAPQKLQTIMARKRAAGNGDNEENVPAAKKARVEPLKLAIAFAWGNKKFSDAQIKIFEEVCGCQCFLLDFNV